MIKIQNKLTVSKQLTMSILMFPFLALSGTITGVNLDNITTDEPMSYVVGDTYFSTIFTDINKTNTNGAISWVESDVMAPGFSIVNIDDTFPATELNCLMTAGENPIDSSIKQCSDPFQTSKRIKMNANLNDTAIDLVFDVYNAGLNSHTYRIFEKFLNVTDISIAAFKIELGFYTGENFEVADSALIGLDFAIDEMIPTGIVETGDTTSLYLDALFPAGLFGVADMKHPIEGYFDATDSARFTLKLDGKSIVSTGITSNYTNLVGNFLSKSQVMRGYFYNHDGDLDTDPVIIAHEIAPDVWVSNRTVQFWSNPLIPIGAPDLNMDGTIMSTVIDNWATNIDYTVDFVEDLANLNLNYHIQIGDAATWPTYDGVSTAKFTLRISSSSPVLFKDGFETIIEE